eukprot:m.273863 g.273863  ORF g.273863 m.273863 type:complete len:1122 (+) comp19342_c1_seq5:82-3447(+)
MAERLKTKKGSGGSSSPRASPRSTPKTQRKAKSKAAEGSSRVTRHVDAKVSARNAALGAMGGVKVDVFVRVRPEMEQEAGKGECVTANSEEHTVKLDDGSGSGAMGFKFDKVYNADASQQYVYDECVAPIVEQVSRGLSCCVFAYGQTGAGKTYTMRGDLSGAPEKRGIIQRSVESLFSRLESHDEYGDVKVQCSFLEVYKEELEDLLVDPPKIDPHSKTRPPTKTKLTLVDDSDLGCKCQGLTEVPVSNGEQVMELLAEAEKRCKFSETKMNKMSNRAHRIFTLDVRFTRYDSPVVATLRFVDLAGSEDISKSGATGLTAREAAYINKSLLTLGRVINALACSEKHIPYRDSKLTRLLSEALGGTCKTSFIACVSPSTASSTETMSTLRYAERAMEALNISQLPRWKQDEIMIDGLTRRVQQLQDDIAKMKVWREEEVNELKSEKAALQNRNAELKGNWERALRKIDRLVTRKTQLKRGLAIMTTQKELEVAHKLALHDELLTTRQTRDGYHADRAALNQVLERVRVMRGELLAAHQTTEKQLTADALKLKSVIESALVNIDELHSEVVAKKTMSRSNEKLVDQHHQDTSEQIRSIIQSVSDFTTDQTQQVVDMVTELKGQRHRDGSTVRQSVQTLAEHIASVLASISVQTASHETSMLGHLSDGAHVTTANFEAVKQSVQDLGREANTLLDAVSSHVEGLQSDVGTWSKKIQESFSGQIDITGKFSKDVTRQLALMQATIGTLAQAHAQQLEMHSKKLASHFEAEKAAIAADSQRLIGDISSTVKRLLTDHASAVVKRGAVACTDFAVAATEMSTSVANLAEQSKKQATATTDQLEAWAVRANKAAQEGAAANKESHTRAMGQLHRADDALTKTRADVAAHAAGLVDTVDTQQAAALARSKDAAELVQTATRASRKLIVQGTTNLEVECDFVRDTVESHVQGFDSQAADLSLALNAGAEQTRAHADEQTEQLLAAEALRNDFTHRDFQRDLKDNPARQPYRYPQEFQQTPAYDTVLAHSAAAWAHEADILAGTKVAGGGTDFPAITGSEDRSGLLTSTVSKPLATDDAELMQEAGADSDVGAYSDAEENGDTEVELAGKNAEDGADALDASQLAGMTAI